MKRSGISPVAEEFLAGVEERIREIRCDAARELLRSLAERTPARSGRARGNWQVLREGESYTGGPVARSPDDVLARNNAAIEEASMDGWIRLINGTPYIRALEYGGRGFGQDRHAYAMVRLSALEFRDIVKRVS